MISQKLVLQTCNYDQSGNDQHPFGSNALSCHDYEDNGVAQHDNRQWDHETHDPFQEDVQIQIVVVGASAIFWIVCYLSKIFDVQTMPGQVFI